jgi:hypothetical protein
LRSCSFCFSSSATRALSAARFCSSTVLFFSFAGWLAIPNGVMGFSFPNIWGTLNAGSYAIFILDLLVIILINALIANCSLLEIQK